MMYTIHKSILLFNIKLYIKIESNKDKKLVSLLVFKFKCYEEVNQSMSKEAVKEFYEILKNNQALQEQIKVANSSASVAQIAATRGYDFTEQELEITMQEALLNEELSEKELEAVSGGGDVPSGGCGKYKDKSVRA